MAKATKKIKVAIVGGGCAALTTAYELAHHPSNRYEITVYQMGWRLGGKGASGRNADESGRIEEHGLHVWMGFYENAFRLIRDCYAKLPEKERVSRFADWQEAFFPDPCVGVVDATANGAWKTWTAQLPPTLGLPGDPMTGDENPFTLRQYLVRSVALLRTLMRSVLSTEPAERKSRRDPNDEALKKQKSQSSRVTPRLLVDRMTRVLRLGLLGTAAGLLEAMTIVEVAVSSPLRGVGSDFKVLQFVDAVAESARRQLEEVIAIDDEVRTKLDLIELVLATVVGIIRDGLLSHPRGLEKIDVFDCRAWLKHHGASQRACESGFVRALYAMAFADAKADKDDVPGIAAGQALRGAFRMFFTYRGALFWKMRAGMGDTVFSPLYEVLKSKGVKFEFFHRLDKVVMDRTGDSPHVRALVFEQQATLRRPNQPSGIPLRQAVIKEGEYYPLDSQGCWPSRPDEDQIEGKVDLHFESGASVRKKTVELTVQNHFDFVVLGISIEAVKATCDDLIKSDGRWRGMVAQVKTIATQALQVWWTQELEKFGWLLGPATVAGIPGKYDTWSDMTHVVPEEGWAIDKRPGSVSYFCSALPYDDAQKLSNREFRETEATNFLKKEALRLFATGGGAKSDDSTTDHLGIYAAVNLNPSDRYVLSRPGSLAYRISPLDNTYDNLTIAGDWTDCGFNEGCVEAAVMSGLLAAHALSGSPALEDIVGYDHP